MSRKVNKLSTFDSNKILPTIYDDSLSYYEFLGKICNTVNEIVEVVNGEFIGYIEKNFNRLMIGVVYDESNETIKLANKVPVGCSTHTYEADLNAMVIERED